LSKQFILLYSTVVSRCLVKIEIYLKSKVQVPISQLKHEIELTVWLADH